MNKLFVLTFAIVLGVAVVAAQTSPCPGGSFGGRRNVKECRLPTLDKCNPMSPYWNYWWEGSCDIWCCPGAGYRSNNCQDFSITEFCCPDSQVGKRYLNSPLAPNCTPDA